MLYLYVTDIRHEDLKKGIYAVGFKKPSKIQEKALPLLLMNPYASTSIIQRLFRC